MRHSLEKQVSGAARTRLRSNLRDSKRFWHWFRSGCIGPAPHWIKISMLLKLGWPDGIWIETGTYEGQTTAALARRGKRVITIEPDLQLAKQAVHRFRSLPHVTVLNGTSEECLGLAIQQVDSGADVNFWLDGHYSGANTYRGEVTTPLLAELEYIQKDLSRVGNTAIFVDDMRLFSDSLSQDRDPSYPTKDQIVNWLHDHGFCWTIANDIAVAIRYDTQA